MKRAGSYSSIAKVGLVSSGPDDDATKTRIRAAIRKLHEARPEDTVIVTWSGHGATIDGKFYLLPSDCGELKDVRKLISSEELAQWMRDIDSTRMALIIDACYSSLENDPDFKPGPMGDRGLGQLAYDKKMLVLTAAREAAFEDAKFGMGLLSHALIREALEQRKAGPGDLTLRKWLAYGEKRVPELYADIARRRGIILSAPRSGVASRIGTRRAYDQRPQLFDFDKGIDPRPFVRIR